MKLPEKKSLSKKKLTIIIIVGVLLLGAVASVLYVYAFNGNLFGWSQHKNDSKINYDKPTTEQKKAGEDAKKKTVDEDQSKETKPTSSENTDQPQAPTPQPGSSKAKTTIDITAANQNGGTLQIRSLIAATTNTGTCTLTLTSGSKTVTKTAGVQALPSNATCQGFDVPVAELSAGTWQAAIHFENSTLVADTSKQIMVQ